MSNDSDISSTSSPSWSAMRAAGIAGALIAGVGIVVRLAVLHDVSPLEDAILRYLQERRVSIVLQPAWTEPLVGLTEIAGFSALGVVIGLVAAVSHWSARRVACVAVAMGALAQILFGLLPRVPL